MRINRFLSQAGLGSRRGVEALIREGRVSVNGEVIQDLGTVVDPERDRVQLDGETVRAKAGGRVWLLHKPRGMVCSFRQQGKSRILPEILPNRLLGGRILYVGRLDRDTSGALLLTDDGDLAHRITTPGRPVWKRYEIQVSQALADEAITRLKNGSIVLDGRPCLPARVPRVRGSSLWLELREGRNRQVRRMIEACGGQVVRLHREAFGPVELGDLAVEKVRPLTAQERDELRELAGDSDDRKGDRGAAGR